MSNGVWKKVNAGLDELISILLNSLLRGFVISEVVIADMLSARVAPATNHPVDLEIHRD